MRSVVALSATLSPFNERHKALHIQERYRCIRRHSWCRISATPDNEGMGTKLLESERQHHLLIEFDLIKEILTERFNIMNDDVEHEPIF